MLTTEDLLAFVTVVEAGSFSAAAERLGQTPSGVSRTLSRLEARLGVSLLTRTTRRLDLTEEGLWLLTRARQVLDTLADTESTLTDTLASPAGRVRVNSATPVLDHLVAPLVAGFLRDYPRIQLELVSGESVVDLIDAQADMAIRVGALADSSLNARRLGESPLRLVAAPAYLTEHGVPQQPAELLKHRLLGFTRPAHLNRWPLLTPNGEGMTVPLALTATSGETLRHLALAGTGIACLADYLVREDVAAGRLTELSLPQQLPWKQSIWAVFYRQGGLAPRLAVWVAHLSRHLSARLSSGNR